jgi:hypothetical protein
MSNTTTQAKGRSTTKTPTRTDRKPRRIPMSGSRKRMHLDKDQQDPNFHYAWINDQKGLIFRSKRAGYENVLMSEIPSWGVADVDSADPSASVISMPVGNGVTAFLMKQPMEYYEEDRRAMDDLVDSREGDMKRSLNSGDNGTYGEVEIDRK